MDISTFSENNFDEIEWINEVFKNETAETKNEAVSQMVSKLQLYLQQVNGLIENTSQNLLSNMPKIIKDVQSLSSEAKSLREKMTEVQVEIQKVEMETGTCMSNLERLDSVKTSLEAAKQGLQESDSWGKLTLELEDLLERKDIPLACDKLYALQKSIIAQQGLSGQMERELQLEDFKNRLEALISPMLVQCFASNDIEESKKFVEIFRNMDRLSQLKHYYRTLQKNILQRQWTDVCESVENQGNERFLKEYYDYLLENWSKQMKWCMKVFNENGIIEGVLVIADLLTSLTPTRETTITSCIKRSIEKLEFLHEISKANVEFANDIKKKLQEADFELPDDYKKMLSSAIFDYFNIFIIQYSSIEQTLLNSKLEGLNVIQSTSTDTIRCLESSNSKVFEWSFECINRCETITQNCSIISVLFALSTFYRSYLDKFKKAQLQLEASRTSDHQDWNLLQLSITLLQNMGTIRLKVNEIEAAIKNIILKKDKQMKENEVFCYKIIGKRDLNEFQKIAKKINDSDNVSSEMIIFENLMEPIVNICKEIHHTMLASVFQPIENDFKKIEISENSSNSELPDFSFTPMEYITLIGQYLLTLPQHLEPLLLNPSTPLKLALELSEPNYKENIPPADILLSLVAEECCALFQEKIANIFSINSNGAKQLATDIEYLSNVLEELGLTICSNLQQIATLLKAPSDSKGYLAVSSGIDARLVTTIRQMRNINMSE